MGARSPLFLPPRRFMSTSDSTSAPMAPTIVTGSTTNVSPSSWITQFPPLSPTAVQQFLGAIGGQAVSQKKEYESQMTTRVSVPVNSGRWGRGRLEMTIGPGRAVPSDSPPIEISLVLPGREVIDFTLHPADLDNLVSQRTLDKLAK